MNYQKLGAGFPRSPHDWIPDRREFASDDGYRWYLSEWAAISHNPNWELMTLEDFEQYVFDRAEPR